ncbi:MAG: Uma2 family endonuclease [Candidatus Competibacter sp.]|nr:Uma2 family endonuclease [Candidatus Competibacter sp.]MDG4584813.1 Uma2 family endonuclease [Candidatus Competibacter sp.]
MVELARRLFVSSAEYLEGEKTAKIRHEYVDGVMRAMAGGSKAHNLIALNLARVLHGHLSNTPCRVFSSDVKVNVAWDWRERFYYPDVVVGCEAGDTDPYVVEQPKLVVEVLSDSTERDDRSDKFYAYRRLPSLEEYVLVAQDTLRVEVYRRETGWDLEVYAALDAGIELRSVGLTLTALDVYEGLPELLKVAMPGSDQS